MQLRCFERAIPVISRMLGWCYWREVEWTFVSTSLPLILLLLYKSRFGLQMCHPFTLISSSEQMNQKSETSLGTSSRKDIIQELEAYETSERSGGAKDQGNCRSWAGNKKMPQSQKFWQWSQLLAASKFSDLQEDAWKLPSKPHNHPLPKPTHTHLSLPQEKWCFVFPLTFKSQASSLTVRTQLGALQSKVAPKLPNLR